jgi:ribosome-associated protein
VRAVPLPVTANLAIPDDELSVSFVRSSGPGGQNVNKVASAVQLRFDLERSAVLEEAVKARLRRLGGRSLTAEGAILIVARNFRSQLRNRREAEARLATLIRRALAVPRPRRATVAPRAAHERRLEGKARHQRLKRLRTRPRFDD